MRGKRQRQPERYPAPPGVDKSATQGEHEAKSGDQIESNIGQRYAVPGYPAVKPESKRLGRHKAEDDVDDAPAFEQILHCDLKWEVSLRRSCPG